MNRCMLRISTCLMVFFLLLGITISANASRKVRVAFFSWPGYSIINRDGSLDGYTYQYLRELAKYTSWEYEFITEVPETDENGNPTGKMKALSYEEGLQLLQKGQADLMGVIHKTPEDEMMFGFPDLPSGRMNGSLLVRGKDTQYQLENARSLDNMRLGVWAKTPHANELKDFLLRIGAQNVQVQVFNDFEEGNFALHSAHTVDGFYSFQKPAENERLLLQLSTDDYYFITNKEDATLLAEFNTGQIQMQIHRPNIQHDLYEQYFSIQQTRNNFRMTPEEKNYVGKHPVIRVGIYADDAPFSFRVGNKEQVHGIVAAIMQEISAMTGLRIQFVLLPKTLQDSVQSNGKAKQWDVLAASLDDYLWADEQGIAITSPYLQVPLSMVTNSSVAYPYAAAHTLAIAHMPYVEEEIQKKYHYRNTQYYASDYDAVQAVNDGKADISFIPVYKTEALMRDPKLNNIVVANTTGIASNLSIGVNKDADPILFQLLNKAVNNIPKATIEQIIIDNTMLQAVNEPFMNMIYRHPFAFTGIVCVILIMLYLAWRKWQSIENDLEMSEKRFRIAVMQSELGIWDYDIVNKRIIQSLNTPAFKEFGQTIEDVPRALVEAGCLYPNSASDFLQLHEKLLRAGMQTVSGTFRFLRKNSLDTSYWLKITYNIIYDRKDKPIWAVGVSTDVTAAKSAEMEILNAKKYEALTLSDVLAKYKIDVTTGAILEAEVYGESLPIMVMQQWDDIFESHMESFVYPDHKQYVYETICEKNLLRGYEEARYRLEIEFLYKCGPEKYYWVIADTYLIKDEATEHIFATIYIKNIDKQKRQEIALKEEAERDPLTSLYNRKYMQNTIVSKLQSMRQGYFLVIDLDNFKHINDHYGHICGDAVLMEFGRLLLRIASREDYIVARFGGDEFVVFAGGNTSISEIGSMAEEIQKSLHNGLRIKGNRLPVSCSIGIAHAPEHGVTFEELYQKADKALYKAKNLGKNCHSFYEEEGILAAGQRVSR